MISSIDTQSLTLFGIDLARLFDRVRLGVHQLIWDANVGVRDRFYPPLTVLSGVPGTTSDARLHCSNAAPPTAGAATYGAVILSDDQVLFCDVTVPGAAESHLDEIVAVEVAARSPFIASDTASGWEIVNRTRDELTLCIAICSRTEAAAQIAAAQDLEAIMTPECWCYSTTGRWIRIQGFGELHRDSAYLQYLRALLLRVCASIAIVSAMMWLPSVYLSIKSDTVGQELARAIDDASEATAVRQRLDYHRELIEAAQGRVGDRVDVGSWLHIIAHLTPDDTYMKQLELVEDHLSVSGLSANAADFLTLLTTSGYFDAIEAPSAFIRERGTDRERFSLTMRLASSHAGG